MKAQPPAARATSTPTTLEWLDNGDYAATAARVSESSVESESAGYALAVSGEGLEVLRQVDEIAQSVRWVSTRGRNLAHAVATSWPVGREGVARCGLSVGAYENREMVLTPQLSRCQMCLDLVEQCADAARAAEAISR